MIIRSSNLLHVNVPKTYLSNPEVSGTTVLRWKNASGFQLSWGIQIGEAGNEQTEVAVLSTGDPTNGTAGTITANTLYEHPSDTSLYAIKYNQVVFDRNTAGTTGGTSAVITGGTVTYQADQPFTQFDDTSGLSTYGYRVRFRNSVSGSLTSCSDWILPTGYSFYSLAKIRQRIKDKLWNSQYITDDLIIDDWVNELKDDMSNAVIAVNEDYALGTVDVAFGTAGLGTITTGDFSSVRRFETTYNGADFYLSTKQHINDFGPNDVYSSVHPFHSWQGDTVFKVQPPESGGTARLTFYRFGTTMVNDTDELPLPMRPFTKHFVNYGVAVAQQKDQKVSAQDVENLVVQAKNDFVKIIVPRDRTSASSIRIEEPTSGDDNL